MGRIRWTIVVGLRPRGVLQKAGPSTLQLWTACGSAQAHKGGARQGIDMHVLEPPWRLRQGAEEMHEPLPS